MDVDGYRALMDEHRDDLRVVRRRSESGLRMIEGGETDFVGYEKTDVLTAIAALEPDEAGRFRAKLHESPFYAEGGGQVSDTGFIEHEETGARAELVGRRRAGDDQTLLLRGGGVLWSAIASAPSCPGAYRFPTMANHTATHLLHKALQEVLGDHVHQAGSAVPAQTSSGSTSRTAKR